MNDWKKEVQREREREREWEVNMCVKESAIGNESKKRNKTNQSELEREMEYRILLCERVQAKNLVNAEQNPFRSHTFTRQILALLTRYESQLLHGIS